MAAKILRGDVIAQRIRDEAGKAAANLKPRVAAIHNEKSGAVRVYMKQQRTACEAAGIPYDLHLIGEKPQTEVAELIRQCAADPAITGITIHQPMPAGFEEDRLASMVPAAKDIEATQPASLGRVEMGQPGPRPVAAAAAVELLLSERADCRGLHAVVVGRSNMVGKPAALLLLALGSKAPTVTICHSGTKDLGLFTRQADIVIAAVGRADTIRGDMLRPGAIVLDIGINRGADGKLVGDVNFAEAEKVVSAITPVPGGVGPVAIALFLRNIVACAAGAP